LPSLEWNNRAAWRGFRPHGIHPGYWLLLALAVVLAFGPITLVDQPLWDDAVIRGLARAGTYWELCKQAGSREQYGLVQPFALAADSRAATLMELLLFCILAPLIYTIIRRTTHWPAPDAFWAALLTALAPLNQARFVLVTLPYAFSCVFFALSIVTLLRDLDATSPWRRVLVAILLMMAFTTNSFLVLAWIPPAVVAIDAWRNSGLSSSFIGRANAAVRAVMGRGELLLLPLVYWPAKKILEPTYGPFADYNRIQNGVAATLRQTVVAFFDQFEAADLLLPARSDLPELAAAAAVAIAILAGLAWIWRLPLNTKDEGAGLSRWIANGVTVAIALALLICALFPYVLVDKPPRFNGLWETRHQTTLMMVSGFAIFACLRLILPRQLLSVTAAAIAAGFLVIDLSVTHRYVADALETRAISHQLKQQPSPAGTMMLILENDRDYRMLGRFFPFYELSYLVNSDVPGGPRMAISNYEVLDPATRSYPDRAIPAVLTALIGLCEKHRLAPYYGFSGFVSNGQIETISLDPVRPVPGPFQTLLEALRMAGAGGGVEPAAAVRLVRETAPIGGACTSPCCSGS
jgi:hypothetical protein